MSQRRTILLLSRQPEAYAVRRLLESAQHSGADLRLVDPHALELGVEAGQRTVRLDGALLEPAQCNVIPRIGSISTEYSLAALEHLELAGCAVLNPAAGLHKLRNKFLMLGYLAAAGLAVPDSILLRHPTELAPAVARLGGYPLVLKFIRGSQGLGVVYAADETAAGSVLEAMNYAQYDVLLQRYYPAAAERDVRVIVLGGRARWAVQRISQAGRFRSNIHRGGRAEPLELAALPQYAAAAEAAARCFGLGLAGVDLIEPGPAEAASTTPNGDSVEPRVLEVNSSPGFETVESAHNADVATEILSFAAGLDLADSV